VKDYAKPGVKAWAAKPGKEKKGGEASGRNPCREKDENPFRYSHRVAASFGVFGSVGPPYKGAHPAETGRGTEVKTFTRHKPSVDYKPGKKRNRMGKMLGQFDEPRSERVGFGIPLWRFQLGLINRKAGLGARLGAKSRPSTTERQRWNPKSTLFELRRWLTSRAKRGSGFPDYIWIY